MSDPHVADELRLLRKQVVRLHRQIALADIEGKVVERDGSKRPFRVRLEIGEDPETGRKVKSPWLKVKSGSNGAFKVSPALPSIGERMRMISPSGIVGAASYATWGSFDDEEKQPDQDKDESVIVFGDTRMSFTKGTWSVRTGAEGAGQEIRFDGSKIVVTNGGKGYEIDATEMRMTQKFRAKNGSRAAVWKGSSDSDGAKNIEGNEDVLV